MIHPHSQITRNDQQFLTSQLTNELVMMNLENGNYICLNEVSADIWKLLEYPQKVENIIDKLIEIYNISKEDCINKTYPFILKMAENGLVSIQ
jgi:hypothetical protein